MTTRATPHIHAFTEYVGRTYEGVTLNWAMRPEPCYSITERCACGAERTQTGMLLPMVPFRRDTDGWPLDSQGNRMRRA